MVAEESGVGRERYVHRSRDLSIDLDAEVLWPFYEEVCKLDVPILVHPGTRIFEAQDCHPWLVGSERYDGFKMLATALGFPLLNKGGAR